MSRDGPTGRPTVPYCQQHQTGLQSGPAEVPMCG
jgi:hypothetical protein